MEDKGVHSFPKGICPKVNIIARLEYELTYYDSGVRRFNHTPRGHPPTFISLSFCLFFISFSFPSNPPPFKYLIFSFYLFSFFSFSLQPFNSICLSFPSSLQPLNSFSISLFSFFLSFTFPLPVQPLNSLLFPYFSFSFQPLISLLFPSFSFSSSRSNI